MADAGDEMFMSLGNNILQGRLTAQQANVAAANAAYIAGPQTEQTSATTANLRAQNPGYVAESQMKQNQALGQQAAMDAAPDYLKKNADGTPALDAAGNPQYDMPGLITKVAQTSPYAALAIGKSHLDNQVTQVKNATEAYGFGQTALGLAAQVVKAQSLPPEQEEAAWNSTQAKLKQAYPQMPIPQLPYAGGKGLDAAVQGEITQPKWTELNQAQQQINNNSETIRQAGITGNSSPQLSDLNSTQTKAIQEQAITDHPEASGQIRAMTGANILNGPYGDEIKRKNMLRIADPEIVDHSRQNLIANKVADTLFNQGTQIVNSLPTGYQLKPAGEMDNKLRSLIGNDAYQQLDAIRPQLAQYGVDLSKGGNVDTFRAQLAQAKQRNDEALKSNTNISTTGVLVPGGTVPATSKGVLSNISDLLVLKAKSRDPIEQTMIQNKINALGALIQPKEQAPAQAGQVQQPAQQAQQPTQQAQQPAQQAPVQNKTSVIILDRDGSTHQVPVENAQRALAAHPGSKVIGSQ